MRRTRGLLPLLLTTSLAATVAVPLGVPAAAAEPDPAPVAHLPLVADVADTVGAYDGTVSGAVTYADGLTLSSTSASGPFVRLPAALIEDQGEDLTLSVWIKRGVANGNYSAMFFGTPAVSNVPQNYWLLNPANPQGYFKSVFTNATSTSPWSTEVGPGSAANSTSSAAYNGQWAQYTTVITPTSITGYLNGVQVGPAQAKSLLIGDFAGALDVYLGKSNYTADRTYSGSFRDLEVFDEPLTAQQVGDLYAGALEAPSTAPATASSAATEATVTVTWSSVAAGYRSAVDGYRVELVGAGEPIVREVAAGQTQVSIEGVPDGTYAVSVAAVNDAGQGPAAAAGEVTVVGNPTDAQLVDRALDALGALPALGEEVRGSLWLPRTLAELEGTQSLVAQGVEITWESSAPEVISDQDALPGSTTDGVSDVIAQGFVTRPAVETDVTLTATVTAGDAEQSAGFPLTVAADPARSAEDYEAYLFAYFTGNTTADQQIYLATSRGNDALAWDDVNDGQAVLTSTEGTGGLRDPSIIRSVDGDTFYMLATDLDITQTTWPEAYTNGSRYLEIWESNDLVHWSQQRHTLVSPEWVGMTWAPEATWDPTIGAYVVYWSSRVYPEGQPHVTNAPGTATSRIVATTTRDFVHFSEPFIWVDEGDRIDAAVLAEDGEYYRFIKEVSGPAGCQGIITDVSSSLRSVSTAADAGEWAPLENCVTQNAGYAPIVEGPTAFKANPGDVHGPGYYMFADYFSGSGYQAFYTEDIAQPGWTYLNPATDPRVDLPGAPRHGSVIPITRAERDGVLAAYQADRLVTAVEPVSVEVPAGATSGAALPATVTAVYGNDAGRTEQVDVTWESVDYAGLAVAGSTVTVEGWLANGAATPAVATVTAVGAPVTLTDIASNPFRAEIEWLAATGVTTGWSNGDGTASFRPLSNVNRDQMAAFLYRLAGSPSFDAPAEPTFLDVPTDYVFYKEIEWLATTGVTEGWTVDEGVEFRPRIAVNRDVMAAFLYRYAGSPDFDAPAVSPFVDVKTDHVFYKEIAWLNSTGISQGWTVDGDKQFRTTTPVKRDVMAAFLFRYADQFLED